MKNQFHPKYQRKYFWISALKFFVAFWGLPGNFLGFQQPSLFMILLTKSPGSPKSFQQAPKKLQKITGQNFSLPSTLLFEPSPLKYSQEHLDWKFLGNCNFNFYRWRMKSTGPLVHGKRMNFQFNVISYICLKTSKPMSLQGYQQYLN